VCCVPKELFPGLGLDKTLFFGPTTKTRPKCQQSTRRERFTDRNSDLPLAAMKITVARINRHRHIHFDKKNWGEYGAKGLVVEQKKADQKTNNQPLHSKIRLEITTHHGPILT
jgi:hypothetical protein